MLTLAVSAIGLGFVVYWVVDGVSAAMHGFIQIADAVI